MTPSTCSPGSPGPAVAPHTIQGPRRRAGPSSPTSPDHAPIQAESAVGSIPIEGASPSSPPVTGDSIHCSGRNATHEVGAPSVNLACSS
ncbi:hypothetical protein OsI_20122 [Oryza sativa Indica Group]|uniref:Uncharacterized protein n=1 Tax=Oryza sativa subsp. indica TaxID=39946 RepID=B8AYQ3_ORYSI|nr:hypothetical protein OsI_20122 [Oryza sativa Indica Group]